ncbi:uncharacterized protein LOC135836424 isoform X3 [Planococcus citri]|uniref:uncharacterized protein LOC135836424 isoform X3 n=1 Tax=Planococcus citri TaxID=170843 RepID=UPI0031FA2650
MASKSFSADVREIRSLLHRIPTLQQMCSYEVVLTLWRDILMEEEANKTVEKLIAPFGQMYGENVRKAVKQLAVLTEDIKNRLIDDYLPDISHKVDCWMEYTRSCMLPDLPVFVFRVYLQYCVWNSRGEIDYRKTARKLLLECDFDELKFPENPFFSTGFGPLEEFAFMCKFALEDIIEAIDINEYTNCFVLPIDMKTSPLMYYWICKARKRPIPGVKKGAGNLEKLMLSKEEVDNWTIINYFWSRLGERDRMMKVGELLKKYESWRFLKPLLASLTDDELNFVIPVRPIEMMTDLWINLFDYELVYSIWNSTKHLLTGDQFSTLLKKVLQFRYYMDEGYKSTLMKIWNTAEERHREHFVTLQKDVIEKVYFSSDYRNHSRGLQFLSVVLAHPMVDADYRKDLILQRGYQLAINHKYSDVEEIIKIFLPDAADVAQLKKTVIESPDVKKFCVALFNHKSDPEYINKFVQFYAPDEATMTAYLKQIAESKAAE